MEQASAALVATSYFEVESICIKAMELARRASDFETMSRIVLPLQEARRQRRHMATDARFSAVITQLPSNDTELAAGCYLLKPPLIGADAPTLRALAFTQNVPVVIMTREPRTGAGRWPVVAVASYRSFRIQLDVPKVNGGEIGDEIGPDASWFMIAIEAVGDVGLASLKPKDPAVFRVDDLWELMMSLPEHEKIHQRFALECRLAMNEPRPDRLRRRGVFEDMATL